MSRRRLAPGLVGGRVRRFGDTRPAVAAPFGTNVPGEGWRCVGDFAPWRALRAGLAFGGHPPQVSPERFIVAG